jgi:FecR protein
MKIAQIFVAAVIGALVMSFASGVYAQTQPGYATVVRIKGQARYSLDGNVWHPLTVGQTLGAGAAIQTAADSTVDLVLGNKIATHIQSAAGMIAQASDPNVRGLVSFKAVAEQNAIRMYGDTVLAVDKLTAADTGVDAVSDTELDLRQGKIFGNVKKLSAASQFLIKIPNGVAGVRGTTFVLSADGTLTVTDGSVVLSVVGSDGKTYTETLGPGDQFNPTTGQITHLTDQELTSLEQTHVEVITIEEGIYRYAHDLTTVYVSPNK